MKKTILASLVAGSLAVVSSGVLAEEKKGYSEWALSYEMLTNEAAGDSASAPVVAIKYRSIGKRWNNFGTEFVLGVPVGEGTAGSAKVKNGYWGGYFAGLYPVNETFDITGKLGYASVTTTATVGSVSASESNAGMAWGFGASYKLNNKVALNLEYNKVHSDVGGIALGASYRF